VTANRADDEAGGGGVYTSATLTLHGSSAISGNHAGAQGGGVRVSGEAPAGAHLVLDDTSSISGNSSDGEGAGVASDHATVRMNDASSISGNVTSASGGGYYGAWQSSILVMRDASSITGNAATIPGRRCQGIGRHGRRRPVRARRGRERPRQHAGRLSPRLSRSRPRGATRGQSAPGGMFWVRWKRLVGS
jgi:hypothetical protein